LKENCRAWQRSLEKLDGGQGGRRGKRRKSYVKSPVASLCFACSSVRKRVRVTMSVLIFSGVMGACPPFVAMVKVEFGKNE